ncbi:hypothetical protein ACOJA9_10570 [Corynebacterium striatum]|uniref:hypothetical protein n=1 Tax=Corynebacterium striatum TaxID=43770 RepID=UPI003B633F9B
MTPRIYRDKEAQVWVVAVGSLTRPCASFQEAQLVMQRYLREKFSLGRRIRESEERSLREHGDKPCSYYGCEYAADVEVQGMSFCIVHGANARKTLRCAA